MYDEAAREAKYRRAIKLYLNSYASKCARIRLGKVNAGVEGAG